MWCIDKRNGLVIPGYVVEGTLGKVNIYIYKNSIIIVIYFNFFIIKFLYYMLQL